MISKELSSLESLCARKEYCTKDIYAKALKLAEGDAEQASELVAALVESGFVDDSRYACAFASDKAVLDGWGPLKIRMALRGKGIPDPVIASALEAVDEEKAEAKLVKVLEAKWKSLSGDPAGRYKLIRFILSRGYEYSQIEGPVREIAKIEKI